LAASALSCDIAILYVNWLRPQKAADAAVLADANYLPSNGTLAISTANSYARLNGIGSGEIVSTNVAPDDLSITVSLAGRVPYYFATLLGLTNGWVSAKATAGVQASGSARSLVPLGIQYGTNLATYQSVTLKLAPQQGFVGPGNWEPLAMGSTPSADPGGSRYKSNINMVISA
jgi:hypothetical protein